MRRVPSLSRFLMTASMSALLLASPLLTACSNFERQPPRYNTVTGPKRPPALNPGGAGGMAAPDAQAADPSMPAGMMAGAAAPSAPMSDLPPEMAMDLPPADAAMMAAPPMADVPSDRKVPVGNQQALASEGAMAPMAAAPMAPVMAAELQSPPMMAAPPAQSGLEMGVQPQPQEMAAYQPMTNAEGEFPVLSDVPPVTPEFKKEAKLARQQASSFTQNAQELPPLAASAEPAPAPDMPPAPSYQQEMQTAAPAPMMAPEPAPALPAFAPPPPPPPAPQPEPASPMQAAGESVEQYYAEPVPAPMPAPAPEYAAPAPTMRPYYGDAAPMAPEYAAAPSGLPPIQLRAPASLGTASSGSAPQGSYLPPSRYAARQSLTRPGVLRH
jgi:hypothetical protein